MQLFWMKKNVWPLFFFFVPMNWNNDLLFLFVGAHIMKTYALWRLQIWRNGDEVNTCQLFALKHDDLVDQIYYCTLWKHHQFVKSLQFSDQVHVYAQFGEAKWASIVVEEVAIIMVHGKDGHPTIVFNSDVLDKNTLQDPKTRLSKFTMKNNPTIDFMVCIIYFLNYHIFF